METKLTLKLDKEIIESAKEYAQKENKSLSHLVEEYFKGLIISTDENKDKVTPLVKELSGILKEKDIKNWKKDYIDFLESKYE
jgi:hypothetical protein